MGVLLIRASTTDPKEREIVKEGKNIPELLKWLKGHLEERRKRCSLLSYSYSKYKSADSIDYKEVIPVVYQLTHGIDVKHEEYYFVNEEHLSFKECLKYFEA